MKKIIIAVMVIIAILLAVRFILGGPEDGWICDKGQWVKHGNPSYPMPTVSCSTRISLPKTEDECVKQGGVWKRWGLERNPSCNRKAVDRGNLCRDSGECEGRCQAELTREELTRGMQGKLAKHVKMGQCSVWVREYGCQGIMVNGAVKVFCFD